MLRSILLALISLLLCGCSKSDASPTGEGAGPPVAFLLSTLQEERYQKDQRYFEARAKELGLSPFTLAADNDNAKQLAQVEDALTRGAKVLVIQATDSAAASAYVKKAHAAGAKVIAYDRSINDASLDFYVAHDSRKVGALSAKAAVDATKGKGKFVLLHGQSGHSVAKDIARGYMDVLKPYIDKGDIEIVAEKDHASWSPEEALKTVEDAIARTGGKIDAILANNSGMARGAVQAVQASDALRDKKVFIAGADADAANVNYVCEGKQSVEVLKDIQPLAVKAAEVAFALASGKPVEGQTVGADGKIPVANVDVHLITPSTVKKLLIDSGFHSASALPACK